MPEGPEIRRAADKISKRIQGTRVVDVTFGIPALENREAEILGRMVELVEARGKALLISFAKGPVLYSRNQLYGKWTVCKAGKRPATQRQLRVALLTDTNYEALLYSASEIELLETSEVSKHPYLSRLGPDVLNASGEALLERLQKLEFQKRSLGSLFLNQHFLSGVGNYLRSEILFFARLSPQRKLGSLTLDEKRGLADSIRTICCRAYAQAGVTVPWEEAQKQKQAKVPRYRYRHYAFGSVKRSCCYCHAPIERGTHSGRRIYFCPRCQRG
jgi:endonuclease VIII